jgi:hypothetical protein
MKMNQSEIPNFLKTSSDAENVFSQAYRIVEGEKATTYGDPNRNLRAIATLWSAYIGTKYRLDIVLSSEDVAWLMIQLKTARAMHSYHRDNIVDTIGYASLIDQLHGVKPPITGTVRGVMGEGRLHPSSLTGIARAEEEA